MPLPALAFALLPALAKAGLGAYQMTQKVARTDTTTPAELELMAMQRQAAASAVLPGQGMMQNRLAQTQAATVQNARLGAASSADFLAAAGAADAQRGQGEAQLAVRGLQYQDQKVGQLQQGLQQQAIRYREDTDRADKANAAMRGSALTNLFGGLTDGASAGVAQAMGGLDKIDPATLAAAQAANPAYIGRSVGLGRGYNYGPYDPMLKLSKTGLPKYF